MELGIDIDPRVTVIKVGEELRPKVETVTCGGRNRDEPSGLSFASQNPKVASVRGEVVVGVSRGKQVIDVESAEFDHLGTIRVTVAG